MRILLFHNRYQLPSGEDTVLEHEMDLLRGHGHTLEVVIVGNKNLNINNIFSSMCIGLQTIWNHNSKKIVQNAIENFQPDIIHIHNFFPIYSPSIYWAISKYKIPIVQTLHNYRIICANGLLFRDEHPCELCIGRKVPLPAVIYKCYRNSRIATLPLFFMQLFHKFIGTFQFKIDAYIVLTQFAREKFLLGGLKEDKVFIKPNFIPDPLPAAKLNPMRSRKKQFIFVGRLAYEKGVDLILEAWNEIKLPDWTLIIVGDGPDRHKLQSNFREVEGVEWTGWLEKREIMDLISHSSFLILASRWFEGFPMVLLEAISMGTPVVAPNHGSFSEIISNGKMGLLFEPNNVPSLSNTLASLTKLPARNLDIMSQNAREAFENYYSSERNYNKILEIYNKVLNKTNEDINLRD